VAPPRPVFPLHEDWRIETEGPAGSQTHSSLVFDGDTLFLATPAGIVSALDASSGAERFRVAPAGALAAADGLLIVKHSDGSVDALSARDGSSLWTTKTGIAGEVPALVGAGRVVLAGRGMAALDASSGERLWSVRGLGHFSTAPVVVSNRILAGTQEGTLHCIDFATGTLVWSYRTKGPLAAAPVADTKGRLYLGGPDGRIVGLKLSTGKRLWRWIVGTDTALPGAVVDDVVCFASHDAVLHALRRSNGHLAWRSPLPSRPLSAPILQGSTVFVACYGSRENLTTFVAVDAKTGKRRGVFDLAGELDAPPVFLGTRFVVALRAGGVVGLSLAEPRSSPEASPQGTSPTPTPGAAAEQPRPATTQP
jgi:outer membrane protein assembly factor BamB